MRELLDLLENRYDSRHIKCSYIEHDGDVLVLHERYDYKEYLFFIDSLDFDYYSSIGGFYGIIWFDDGSWLERDFDGEDECWMHRECPLIPKDCYPLSDDDECCD